MKTIAQSLFLALPLALAPVAFAQHQTFTVAPDASKVVFSLGEIRTTWREASMCRAAQSILTATRRPFRRCRRRGGQRQQRRSGPRQENELRRPRCGALCRSLIRAQKLSGNRSAQRDSTIQVTGIFTLHGTPHDLTVPMQIHIDGAALTAKTHFQVPYVQWGLKDPSIFILKVAKVVDIDLMLEGRLSSSN